MGSKFGSKNKPGRSKRIMGYIYKIETPSKRVYIGQTIDLDTRKRYYSNNNCERQKVLFNSLKKYGFDSCKFDIIEEVLNDDLDKKERYYIDYFKSNISKYPEFKGLNLTDGGVGVRGYVWNDEQRANLSKVRIGNDYAKGFIHTTETRSKISDAQKKLILDESTGVFYFGLKEAGNAINISSITLGSWLRGFSPNKSKLKYC